MAQTSKQNYYGILGYAQLSTANPNLDGSGAIVHVIDGAGQFIVNSITIKAQQSTQQGMIRLFLADPAIFPTQYQLWKEIPVPATVQSDTNPAYQITISASLNLAESFLIAASTQNAENWNVIIEAMGWTNCECA